MKKIVFITVLAVSIAALPLFSNGDKEVKTSAEKPVELRLLLNTGTNTTLGTDQEAVIDYMESQILKEYGIAVDYDIKVAASGEVAQIRNLMIAARELDAWNENKDAKMMSDEGFLADLGPSIERYGSHIKKVINKETMWDSVTYKGKIVGVPTYNNVTNKAFWVRKDLFEQLGLKFDRVMTISQLETYMAMVMKEYPDMIPMGRTIKPSHWFAEFINSIGYPDNLLDSKGLPKKYLIGKNSETVRYIWDKEYEERLTLLQNWWNKGYFDPEWLTWSRSEAIAIVEQGNCAAAAAAWWRTSIFERLAVEKNQDWKHVVIIQDDGKAVYHDRRGWDSRAFFLLGSAQEKADAAIATVDWLMADVDNILTAQYGIPGTHWDYTEDRKNIISLAGPNAPGFEDHDDVVLGTLHDLTITVPFQKETGMLMNTNGIDTFWYDALEPQTNMVVSAIPDNSVNYSDLEELIRERGIFYNVADAETYIHEVEAKVMVGELGVQEGIALLQKYANDNGFEEWWSARMEIYQKETK